MYLFVMFWIRQQNDDSTLWLPNHPPEVISSVLHWTLCGYERITLLVALNVITGIQIVNHIVCVCVRACMRVCVRVCEWDVYVCVFTGAQTKTHVHKWGIDVVWTR